MLVDARTIPSGERVEADICIVGAGPAGLAVALELERSALRIVLLARDRDPPGGEVVGEPYPPLEATCANGIGGTAALWDAELSPDSFGARYAPLDAIDFEDRTEWSAGGWPFDRAALDPHYVRAQEFCEAGPYDYTAPAAALPVQGAELATGVFRFGPAAVFTETHRRRVAQSEHVRGLTGAVVTRILTDDDGRRVTSLEVASTSDRRFSVAARTYVLAAGGVENPRLLLISRTGDDRVVGRCFMDHPTIRCRLDVSAAVDLSFFDTQGDAGNAVLGRLELSAETMRRQELLNGGFFFVPARDRELRAASAARELLSSVQRRRVPPQPLRLATDVARGADTLAYRAHRRVAMRRPAARQSLNVWPRSRLLDTLGVGPVSGWSRQRRRPRAYDVYHVIEQAPDFARRVSLSDARDDFGLPLPRLHWFVGERELASAERAEAILQRRVAEARIGAFRRGSELAADGDLASAVHPSAHHHLGTTRMHVDPRLGVVDADGRVHGVANLFVAGGSIFPTSGFVNPTLTIVALALRLGAHLREDRAS